MRILIIGPVKENDGFTDLGCVVGRGACGVHHTGRTGGDILLTDCHLGSSSTRWPH